MFRMTSLRLLSGHLTTLMLNHPWPFISEYYNHDFCSSLLQLYKSLVLPHLEYASAIGSPSLLGDKTRIENVQKFALRMCTKCWGGRYDYLLICLHCRGEERFHACAFFFMIIYGLCYFGVNCVFTPISIRSYHSSHHLTLLHPFSHTNSHMHSFVPATIGLWTHLDEDTVLSPSLASFKFKLYH